MICLGSGARLVESTASLKVGEFHCLRKCCHKQRNKE